MIMHLASGMISSNLTPLLNQILESGIYLAVWKTACRRLILEKTNLDAMEVKNYRPISRLPITAKILERTVNHELMQYLDTNNLLDSSQHGFQSCHSTETALIMATEEIRRQVGGGGQSHPHSPRPLGSLRHRESHGVSTAAEDCGDWGIGSVPSFFISGL